MPDVPGFAAGWGTSIVPCPYCDGFEVAGQHWGLVWSGPQSHNHVRLFHDWTDRLTLFADGHDIPPDIRADLTRRNTPVVEGRIIEIAHHGGHNATVKLDTGPTVAVDILFAHPRNKPSASLHESLGLATGALLFVAGAAMMLAAAGLFRRLGTNVPPSQPTTLIATTGPYRWTRNPMYLGMALVYAGLAIGFDGPIAFALLPDQAAHCS